MALRDRLDPNQLLARMERLPMSGRLGLVAAVFVGLIGIYWFTLYGGQRQQLHSLQGQLSKLEARINESRAVASNLKTFQEKRESLKAELAEALRRLPNQKELPILLTDITSLGKKSGLEFRSFKPAKEVPHGFYAEVPIQIELTGGYHDVAVFFDRLSQLSRIVNLGALEISIASYTGETPLLRVKGVATTYRFNEGGASSEGAESGTTGEKAGGE